MLLQLPRGGKYAWNQFVLAVVNTLSGERKAINDLLKMLESELGADRVVSLNKDMFRDTTALERRIRDCTFCPVSSAAPHVRGTVIVAGGDGTVSFIYQILGKMSVRMQQRAGDNNIDISSGSSFSSGTSWLLPGLAVIPLGTGNDYSNCMGFGTGFTASEKSGCGCCASDHTPLKDLTSAPCYVFDRWRVTFIPLHRAQSSQNEEGMRYAKRPEARITDAIHAIDWEEASRERVDGSDDPVASPPSPSASFVEPTAFASSYHLINYLGVGFDAYVCTNFDKSRKAHPDLCSTRAANKMVYGVHSLKGAVTCTPLQKLLPMICIPSSSAIHGHTDNSTLAASSGHNRKPYIALALPSSSKALVASNVDRYAAGTTPWGNTEKQSITTASAKTRPVDIQNDKLVRIKRDNVVVAASLASSSTSPLTGRHSSTTDDNHGEGGIFVPLSVPDAEERLEQERYALPTLPALKKVAVNDGLMELQSMGGIFHYGNLQMGISHSDKLTQSGEAYIFVLCTPQDLLLPSCSFSKYSEKAFKDSRESLKKKAMSSLYVQVDGEPVPPIREPMVIRITKEKGEVWCRCARTTSVEGQGEK